MYKLRKRGLKRKVTDENRKLVAYPHKIENFVAELLHQKLSDCRNQTGLDALREQMKICFIKNRSVKHTEVLSPQCQFGK